MNTIERTKNASFTNLGKVKLIINDESSEYSVFDDDSFLMNDHDESSEYSVSIRNSQSIIQNIFFSNLFLQDYLSDVPFQSPHVL